MNITNTTLSWLIIKIISYGVFCCFGATLQSEGMVTIMDYQETSNRHSGLAQKVIVAVLCIVVSGSMGFFGGYVANQNNNTVVLEATATPVPAGTKTPVKQDEDVFTSGQAKSNDPMTIAEVAEQVAGSVVEITTETVTTDNRLQQYVSTGAGSGVIFREDGYIVTNNHVIDGAEKITVTLKDGSSYTAVLVGTDPQTDIAVLRIEATGLPIAELGDSDTLVVGQTAIAIGNPLGSLGGTVTNGIISALDREIAIDDAVMNLLQTNAAVNPGNSGGGLFDANGLLIGLVNAKSSGSDIEGLGFAIPVNTVKTIISDLVRYGYVKGRPDTGMTFVEINDALSAMQYRVSSYGLYVYSIDTLSNAYAAGLRTGDYIVSVNGNSISSRSQLNSVVRAMSIGDTIEFTVVRSRQTASYSFVLQEYTVDGFS